MRRLKLRLPFSLFVLLAAACGSSDGSSLPQKGEPANLDPDRFVARIDHPYWPMRPGSRWVYREGPQRVVVTVTNRRKLVEGIEATVVHDVVTEDGELVEDTWDWYGQDDDGNLWYLGEQTKELEHGRVVTTKGSWQAGVDGAEAGIVLPAKPEVGQAYRQEYLEGEAEDEARILSVDEQAEVPFGSFAHVLMTKDFTRLEPDLVEHKFYARGVGPVLTVTVSGGSDREELVRYTG